jgi:alpha-glucosidase
VAPWRILNEKNLEICRKYAKLHEEMGGYIVECAHHSSQTNEPIVRSMECQYPHQGGNVLDIDVKIKQNNSK